LGLGNKHEIIDVARGLLPTTRGYRIVRTLLRDNLRDGLFPVRKTTRDNGIESLCSVFRQWRHRHRVEVLVQGVGIVGYFHAEFIPAELVDLYETGLTARLMKENRGFHQTCAEFVRLDLCHKAEVSGVSLAFHAAGCPFAFQLERFHRL